MQPFATIWLMLWTGMAWGQEEIIQAVTATGQGLTLGGGDITFPSALVLCTYLISKWTPAVKVHHVVDIRDKREKEK